MASREKRNKLFSGVGLLQKADVQREATAAATPCWRTVNDPLQQPRAATTARLQHSTQHLTTEMDSAACGGRGVTPTAGDSHQPTGSSERTLSDSGSDLLSRSLFFSLYTYVYFSIQFTTL